MPDAKRVLHVTEAFGGGVQSAIAHFISETPTIDHTLLARARAGEQTRSFDVPLRLSTGSAVTFARDLLRTVDELRPDAVHFHSSVAGGMRPLIGLLTRHRRPRVVYSPHCFAFERTDVPSAVARAFHAAESLLARATDAFVTVSPHERDLAGGLAGDADVVLVANATTTPPEISIRAGSSIVMVGRISAQKDPAMFARLARQSDTGREYVWIGDGDSDLRELLVDAGVRVTGWLEPNSLRAELDNARLYFHSAAWEASPMSILEAANHGVPVICREIESLRSLGYHCVSADGAAVAVSRFLTDADFASEVASATADALRGQLAWPTATRLREAYRTRQRGSDDVE